MKKTPFKDDIIPEDYKKLLGNSEFLKKEQLMSTIVNKEIILDYFNFENNLKLDM